MKHSTMYTLALTTLTTFSLCACAPMFRGGPIIPILPLVFPIVAVRAPVSSLPVKVTVEQSFFDADIDGDNVISQPEFLRSLPVKKFFINSDTNGDHAISEKEFSTLLQGDQAFINADINNDQVLSQQEFAHSFPIEQLFINADINGDRMLVKGEFTSIRY